MRFQVLCGAAVVTLAAAIGLDHSASAADLPLKAPRRAAMAPAPATWTGLYIGGHIGYGWGRSDLVVGTKNVAGDFWDLGHDVDGFIGGGQVGYNWQQGNLVFGLVGDISFSDVDGTGTNCQCGANYIGANGPKDGPPGKFTTSYDWIATIRARGGRLLTNETLVYAHGGVAFADISLKEVGGAGPWKTVRNSDVKTGLVVGAGVEHKLNPDWSVFAEYSYMLFGAGDLKVVIEDSDFKGTVHHRDNDLHTFKGGVNWKIGP
jgi:outer membrane immunogenic protein